MKRPADIEIVEDLTDGSRCDEGFLRIKRFVVRNLYEDGTHSEPYDCDVVSRRQPDAVAVALYEIGADGIIRVALRAGVRPAVYLRRHKQFVQPDDGPWLLLVEVAAGLLEADDTGPGGLGRRAAAEAAEETGYRVAAEQTAALGGPQFPTPGITDEKVFYRAVAVTLSDRGEAHGDGSVMEEAGGLVVLPLREAIQQCRSGEIPDMKTEIMLLRLCDLLGYIPQLDLFTSDLPAALVPDDPSLGIRTAAPDRPAR